MALFDAGISTQCEVAAAKEAMEEEPCLKNPADATIFLVMAIDEVCWSCMKLCGFALKMDVLILNVSKFMGLPVSNVWAIVYEQGVQRCVSFVSNPEICNSVYTSSTAQGGGGSFKNRNL